MRFVLVLLFHALLLLGVCRFYRDVRVVHLEEFGR